jgi:hypothetical protein
VRTSLALICTLALLASPYFFAYLEAERLLGWPDAMYRLLDPWVPLLMIVFASFITFLFPWIVGLFAEEDSRL